MDKLRIGIFGTGHLGSIHVKCIQNLDKLYEIVGFHDPNEEVQARMAREFGIKAFRDPGELMNMVDAIDVVAPTVAHYDLISRGLGLGRHVFTEKPVTETVEQAEALVRLAADQGRKVQVGHVERFNPAYMAVSKHNPQPMFVEGHRLAMFNPRGTDVSVVHDLMIHDIDILVALIPDEVTSVQASGVGVISDQPDICNARIEFANGAVANLTASRISLKSMRKFRMFQRDAYISVDFLEKKSEIIKLYDHKPADEVTAFQIDFEGETKWLCAEFPEVVQHNAIEEEFKSFHDAVKRNRTPDVSLSDALKAMRIAQTVLDAIDKSTSKVRI